ncbi:MAG: hypothetical protein RB191_09270 [Terriglobia bacterium]|nr:hypothetical protein [Terriglobia bacterium]
MKRWYIGELLSDLANASRNRDSVLEDLKTLFELCLINPRNASLSKSPPERWPDDRTYLNQRDASRVIEYANKTSATAKKSYLLLINECGPAAYTLAEAATIISSKAGLRYKTIIAKLKQAVINQDFIVFGSSNSRESPVISGCLVDPRTRRQQSDVRIHSDQVVYSDLNAWCLKMFGSAKMANPFPSPYNSAVDLEFANDTQSKKSSGDSNASFSFGRSSWRRHALITAIRDMGENPSSLARTPGRGNNDIKQRVFRYVTEQDPRKWVGSTFQKTWAQSRQDGSIKDARQAPRRSRVGVSTLGSTLGQMALQTGGAAVTSSPTLRPQPRIDR